MMGAAGAEGLSADAADGVLAGLMEGAASRSPEGMSAALDRADAERANGDGAGGARAEFVCTGTPFHPQRLWTALFQGPLAASVRCSCGTLWIAARPHVTWRVATADVWIRIEADRGDACGGGSGAAAMQLAQRGQRLHVSVASPDDGVRVREILQGCLLTDAELGWGPALWESRLANPFFPLERRDNAEGVLAAAATASLPAAETAAVKAAAAKAAQAQGLFPWSKRACPNTDLFSSPAATDATEGSSDVSEQSAERGGRAAGGVRQNMLLPIGAKKARLKPIRVLRRRKRELEAMVATDTLSSLAMQEARDELAALRGELAALAGPGDGFEEAGNSGDLDTPMAAADER